MDILLKNILLLVSQHEEKMPLSNFTNVCKILLASKLKWEHFMYLLQKYSILMLYINICFYAIKLAYWLDPCARVQIFFHLLSMWYLLFQNNPQYWQGRHGIWPCLAVPRLQNWWFLPNQNLNLPISDEYNHLKNSLIILYRFLNIGEIRWHLRLLSPSGFKIIVFLDKVFLITIIKTIPYWKGDCLCFWQTTRPVISVVTLKKKENNFPIVMFSYFLLYRLVVW